MPAKTVNISGICGNPECNSQSERAFCSTKCRHRAQFLREFDTWKDKDHKPCRSCGNTKPLDDFRNPGMLHCQACMKIKRQRQYEKQGGKEYVYAVNLALRYGMTVEEYNERVNAQGGRCAICRDEPKGKRPRLNVDHDHKTGAVRDLLCSPCNRALGNAEDDPARLQAMITYLRRHSAT